METKLQVQQIQQQCSSVCSRKEDRSIKRRQRGSMRLPISILLFPFSFVFQKSNPQKGSTLPIAGLLAASKNVKNESSFIAHI